MKYYAYIYIKNNVLRMELKPNLDALAKYQKDYPKGKIFEIQTDTNDADEWVLEKPIQEMYRLLKIIYKSYFILYKYSSCTNEHALYKAIKGVSEEYAERSAELD